MVDTVETSLQITYQEIGGNDNTWGDIINQNWTRIVEALTAASPIAVTTGTVSLTDDQQRPLVLVITGTLVGNVTIKVNDVEKFWYAINNTTGAFTVTIETDTGTGAVIPQGSVLPVWSDGTNCIDLSSMTIGVDDQATGAQITITDTDLVLGENATSTFDIFRFQNDESLSISGGSSADDGFNAIFYGGAHATLADNAVFRAGLTDALTYDGSALWDFETNRVGNIGAATVETDALQAKEVVDNAASSANDSGAADAYVLTLVPAATAYTKYMELRFTTANTNTGASTVNVNVLGLKNIKRTSGDDLLPGDISITKPNRMMYDGTQFILLDGDTQVLQGIKHKELLSGVNIRPTVTSGALLTDGEFGTVNLTVPILNFADAVIRVADATFIPEKSYDGGPIRIKAYWGSGTAGGGNAAEWEFSAAFFRDLDALGAALGTPVTLTSPAPATLEDISIDAWTGDITPGGTYSDDALLAIRIRRLGTDANDTFLGTAGLIGVVVEYTTNAPTDA